MATRFRLTGTSAIQGMVTPAGVSAEWDHQAGVNTRFLAVDSTDSPMASKTTAHDAADHHVYADAITRQYTSLALASQTITAQTVKLQIRMNQTDDTNNLFLAVKLFLIDSLGAVVSGGTILALTLDDVGLTTTLTNRSFSATTTEVTVVAGQHLCMEIGASGTPTASAGVNDHDFVTRFGDPTAGTDLPEDDTTTTDNNPWLEFANTITFAGHPQMVRWGGVPGMRDIPRPGSLFGRAW